MYGDAERCGRSPHLGGHHPREGIHRRRLLTLQLISLR